MIKSEKTLEIRKILEISPENSENSFKKPQKFRRAGDFAKFSMTGGFSADPPIAHLCSIPIVYICFRTRLKEYKFSFGESF